MHPGKTYHFWYPTMPYAGRPRLLRGTFAKSGSNSALALAFLFSSIKPSPNSLRVEYYTALKNGCRSLRPRLGSPPRTTKRYSAAALFPAPLSEPSHRSKYLFTISNVHAMILRCILFCGFVRVLSHRCGFYRRRIPSSLGVLYGISFLRFESKTLIFYPRISPPGS